MAVTFVISDKKTCQNLISELKSLGVRDRKYPIQKFENNRLGIPVNSIEVLQKFRVGDNTFEISGKQFFIEKCVSKAENTALSPAAKLKAAVKQLLENKNVTVNLALEKEIPQKWEKYGDIVIFRGDEYFKSDLWRTLVGSELWQVVCDALKVHRVAIRRCIKPDDYRSPRADVVYGNSTWITHIDNGIKYSWNVEKNMFCAGNAPERHRVANLDCTGEVVVDMYAGIGYFTLPYLLHAGAKRVHACEWNPDAVIALRYNLAQNNVSDRCIIHEGDNRDVCPVGVANRVNLGLLPSSRESWRAACIALDPTSGGVLHVHENVTSGMLKGTNEASDELANEMGNFLNECSACMHIISVLTMQEDTFCVASNVSFRIRTCKLQSQVLNNMNIRWKKAEWKMWALHTCHTICELLDSIHSKSQTWEVSVTFVHHVKSYAPHVDHLVLDLKCTPI